MVEEVKIQSNLSLTYDSIDKNTNKNDIQAKIDHLTLTKKNKVNMNEVMVKLSQTKTNAEISAHYHTKNVGNMSLVHDKKWKITNIYADSMYNDNNAITNKMKSKMNDLVQYIDEEIYEKD